MTLEPTGSGVSLELVNTVLAARRFYLDGASKSDIAEELGLSRFKVTRLLDAARRDGIVRITIDVPAEVNLDLSASLAAAYGIKQALVIKVLDPAEDFIRLQLGRAGAALLANALEADDVLGVSWGRTLQAMVGAIDALPACTVVQIVGGNPVDLNINSMELVRQLAEHAGGAVYPLHVPMLFDSPAAAATLREEFHVRRTFEMFGRLTKAVVGIGAWEPDGFALQPALPENLAEHVREAGAVADVCMTPLDDEGRPVELDELSSRLITIGFDQLSRVPEVIGIAGGVAKAHAIAATLRSGVLHRLVTDENCAQELMRIVKA
ncbi:sugar-binding transcriptional regulator [Streptomyces adonidis]|uniref:sugar-binding transcriptional regulator n=1 Tax=Streptomyces adonidis TaxID=3231367 RepID=UPI0034DACD4E